MKNGTWIIIGATSAIAEAFAGCAAAAGSALLLVGRDACRLEVLQADLRLRHKNTCDILVCDLAEDSSPLLQHIQNLPGEVFLFLAQGIVQNNEALDAHTINTLLAVNVASVIQCVHAYLERTQPLTRIVFLSSVAAMRGRAKNSFYGGTKSAVDVYLQGLQQHAAKNRHITIARLGFVDTRNTFGIPGSSLAISPEHAARACFNAMLRKKRMVYIPFFWRLVMGIIVHLPFWAFRRMGRL